MNTGRTHFKRGYTPWNKGKVLSPEHAEKISRTKKGKIPSHLPPSMHGSENPTWKGVNVSYRALHSWVVRCLGQPSTCSNCGKTNLFGKRIHWANISHEYKRDLSDWVRLCAVCHSAYDREKLTLTAVGG